MYSAGASAFVLLYELYPVAFMTLPRNLTYSDTLLLVHPGVRVHATLESVCVISAYTLCIKL